MIAHDFRSEMKALSPSITIGMSFLKHPYCSQLSRKEQRPISSCESAKAANKVLVCEHYITRLQTNNAFFWIKRRSGLKFPRLVHRQGFERYGRGPETLKNRRFDRTARTDLPKELPKIISLYYFTVLRQTCFSISFVQRQHLFF